ncbi:hypothetical protein ANTHELSMS3_00427 [Antarctobacter heliothermus]|uniref:Uncharacterized protein n=1 Tax=Antarctobacter heliothermus TaxID=74033 RepID=A0A222DYW4_9RHOB|nr:hypothetical protein ANTHELSMS3_00427 [Antarctobacter heliothermus]
MAGHASDGIAITGFFGQNCHVLDDAEYGVFAFFRKTDADVECVIGQGRCCENCGCHCIFLSHSPLEGG